MDCLNCINWTDIIKTVNELRFDNFLGWISSLITFKHNKEGKRALLTENLVAPLMFCQLGALDWHLVQKEWKPPL